MRLTIEIERVMFTLRLAAVIVLCLFSVTQLYTQTRRFVAYDAKREMRGIWVATVNNIDWPSSPGLSQEQIKREARNILDRVKRMGMNTVFLQVRPSADAIYRSDIEPMTSYIVGETDKLSHDFDALTYWIDEAHSRGLELHAWINPFRVTPKADFPCGQNHLSKTHPEWTITYAGRQYLNPGLPEARAYVARVVDDITTRYDIDGIHFDDYFYPYPVRGEVFDDNATYEQYRNAGESVDDWRRRNVNAVINYVSTLIKNRKPWVAFGISPFGVWRNKRDDERGSQTAAGITDYDILYADVVEWINRGWVDYVVPQIYWESGNKAADFDELTAWWAALACDATQVYVGHAIFKINAGNKAWENPSEMPQQIEKVRNDGRLSGSVFFSYRQFNRDIFGLEDAMRNNIYRSRSLSPLVMSRSDGNITITNIRVRDNKIVWETRGASDQVRFYAIYRYRKGDDFDASRNTYLVDIVGDAEMPIPIPPTSDREKYYYRISAIDINRNEHPLSAKLSIKY